MTTRHPTPRDPQTVPLTVEVPGDGEVQLRWSAAGKVSSYAVLILRSGAIPAHTSIALAADTTAYHLRNLSRHQRYLIAVAALHKGGTALSAWSSVTPRAGLQPVVDVELRGLDAQLARVRALSVMPQDGRLTAFWTLDRGFVDGVVVTVLRGGRCLRRFELEPEVASLSIDGRRGLGLDNGADYLVQVHSRFAGQDVPGPAPVRVTPAPQGEERRANTRHPQQHLLYPFLSIAPELQVFDDDSAASGTGAATPLLCQHCKQPVIWARYELRCQGCGAEYIPSSLGAVLEVGRLRFGTCACCLPRHILIQKRGQSALTCSHTGKEHIRTGAEGYALIEDLPHGLCQCCRPRRPLVKKGARLVCSKSGEQHLNQDGRHVLAPSQPVFDAAAIDALLDQGLAEICASGVTRAAR